MAGFSPRIKSSDIKLSLVFMYVRSSDNESVSILRNIFTWNVIIHYLEYINRKYIKVGLMYNANFNFKNDKSGL